VFGRIGEATSIAQL
jgi:hypothetical protein